MINFDYLPLLLVLLVVFSFTKAFWETIKRKRLEEQDKKQKEFLADLAHKLITPLAIARTNIDIALRGVKDEDYTEAQEFLFKAAELNQRLAGLCSNLITIGKIEYGFNPIKKSLFNLSELVEKSVSDLKVITGNRDLKTQIEPNIQFFADSSRIQEMLWNLLGNAIKFTDPEKGRIDVRLSVIPAEAGIQKWIPDLVGDDKRGRIVLTIADNGIGIDSKALPSIFNRYYQSEKRAGSAGIGLAIVKWIVQEHQGKISVESELNHGTTFTIKF